MGSAAPKLNEHLQFYKVSDHAVYSRLSESYAPKHSFTTLLYRVYTESASAKISKFKFKKNHAYMIRDPELIKEVLETKGDYSKPFLVPSEKLDPLLSKWSPLVIVNHTSMNSQIRIYRGYYQN